MALVLQIQIFVLDIPCSDGLQSILSLLSSGYSSLQTYQWSRGRERCVWNYKEPVLNYWSARKTDKAIALSTNYIHSLQWKMFPVRMLKLGFVIYAPIPSKDWGTALILKDWFYVQISSLMCVCCMLMHVSSVPYGCQNRVSDPWESELQAVVCCLIQVLRTDLGPFAKAVHSLNDWVSHLFSPHYTIFDNFSEDQKTRV